MTLSDARALDWDAIQAFLAEQMTQCLKNTPEFMGAEYLRDQCYFACQALRTNHHLPVPYSLIARLLGIAKGTVVWHVKRYVANENEECAPGRPSLLALPFQD
jgi:hypothetical protein